MINIYDAHIDSGFENEFVYLSTSDDIYKIITENISDTFTMMGFIFEEKLKDLS